MLCGLHSKQIVEGIYFIGYVSFSRELVFNKINPAIAAIARIISCAYVVLRDSEAKKHEVKTT